MHKVGYFAKLLLGNEETALCKAAVEAEPGDDQSIIEAALVSFLERDNAVGRSGEAFERFPDWVRLRR